MSKALSQTYSGKGWFMKQFVEHGVALSADQFEQRALVLPTELQEGEFLVKTSHVSVDPYYRHRLESVVDENSYIDPYTLDKPIGGDGIGQVVESNNADYPVGTVVSGFLMWAEYCVGNKFFLWPLAEQDAKKVPPSKFLSVLGTTGKTAYFGLSTKFDYDAKDVVVVSAAAGSVGSAAVQLAKAKGCKVIGIAGGPEKCAFVVDKLGADLCINYKQFPREDYSAVSTGIAAKIKEFSPEGVDVYFDNVGGAITEAIFKTLRPKGRVVICGQISQVNKPKTDTGYKNLNDLLISINNRRYNIQGLMITDHLDQFYPATLALLELYHAGKLHGEETVTQGFDNCIEAFLGLFAGKNLGKTIVAL